MRLPRDLSGEVLATRLTRLGYRVTRQTGSHVGLTTDQDGEHHITIPQRSESVRYPASPPTLRSTIISIAMRW